MIKKHKILLLIVFFPLTVLSQGLKGIVVDEDSEPIGFTNLCVIDKTDSTFIMGCASDADGRFKLRYHGDRENKLLRISSIGYETLILPFPPKDSITIILHETPNSINEVIVEGHRPLMKMVEGDLVTNIDNTILSRLGTAVDVLSQMPLIMTDTKGSLTVMGYGKPLVYVDNRLVRDMEELRQLMSDRIKTISIITNPGGKYPSGTQSVINITTSKMKYKGLGGDLLFQAQQRKKFCPHGILNLNYNMEEHYFFLSASMFDYGQYQEQKTQTVFYFDNNPNSIKQEGQSDFHEKKIYLSIGDNWQITENRTIGVKLQYMKPLDSPLNSYFNYDYNKEQSSYTNSTTGHGRYYYLNAYYIDELSPNYTFGIDGTVYYTSFFQTRDISETIDSITNSVNSSHTYSNNLYSIRAWGEAKTPMGKVECGAEYGHTRSHQDYNMFNLQVAKDLPNNRTKDIESNIGVYVGLSNNWKSFSFNANLRLEHVRSNYFLDGNKQEENSKIYNHLLPSLSISYKQNGITASLSYKASTLRPPYSAMKSDINYNSKYDYEGGNPSLKPAVNNQLTLMGIYKDFLLIASFTNIKNGVLYYSQLFNNKPIVLTSYCNNNWCKWQTSISFSPVISCWRPSLTVNYSQQEMRLGDMNYNSPIIGFEWKNMLTINKDWSIILNLEGYTAGNDELYLQESRFSSDFSVKKSFKNLDVYIGANDIFNQNRERYEISSYGIYFKKWSNPDTRCIYLRLAYRFNPQKTKYKGDSSGRSELRRL